MNQAQRILFSELDAFSALFLTYTEKYQALAPYFSGEYSNPRALETAAKYAAEVDRDRDTLAGILLDQNAAWGADDNVPAHIEALRRSDSIAVVTGQQLGLFLGPLYTVYKTITAIQMAQRLEVLTGRPAIPVFWLEGEDHDLAEVVSTHILKGNDLVSLTYTGHEPPAEGNLGPVGRIAFTEQINEVVDALDEALPPTDFKPALMAAVRAAYKPGHTFKDAFALLMRSLFPNAGLVFIYPDDPRLKQLAAPLFQKEIKERQTSFQLLSNTSALLAEDYHAQVHPRSLNLFLLEEKGRYPLVADEEDPNKILLKGTNRVYSTKALLALLEKQPERFSPNVVLRPMMQDWLLPTAAYIAGPGETAYFAQFKALYEWAGIPMPIVYPRASITLVEKKIRKILDREQISLGALAEPLDVLFGRQVLAHMDVDLNASFKQAMAPINQSISQLKMVTSGVDATLGRTAEALRATIMKELNHYKDKVLRAEKRTHDVLKDQLARAQAHLYPGGKLQERKLSVLYFMNKYGTDLPERWLHDAAVDTHAHQVFDL